jgi:hypothetical protein
LSALAGAGLTLVVVAKFGQSWFFKKLDAKYALDLAKKNIELMSELEKKKNDLNKELQIEVTHFKSDLEVLGGQRSKFLEKKVNSILSLNQQHYIAIKNIKELTDTTHLYVNEAMSYFLCQIEDGNTENLSSYDIYRKLKENRWPAYRNKAQTAFDKYSQCLALNMPILPKELVQEEMAIVDSLSKVLEDASMAFHRAMNLTQYIMQPEECETSVDQCMEDLKEEDSNALTFKNILDKLSSQLFGKAMKSGGLIEALLQHNGKG